MTSWERCASRKQSCTQNGGLRETVKVSSAFMAFLPCGSCPTSLMERTAFPPTSTAPLHDFVSSTCVPVYKFVHYFVQFQLVQASKSQHNSATNPTVISKSDSAQISDKSTADEGILCRSCSTYGTRIRVHTCVVVVQVRILTYYIAWDLPTCFRGESQLIFLVCIASCGFLRFEADTILRI